MASPTSSATTLLPVYALVGSDPFLQLEALQDVLSLLKPDAGGGGGGQRADFEGDRAQLAEVLDELRSFSMFAATKVVVLRDGDDFISKYREKLEDFLVAVAAGKESVAGTLILRLSSLPANQRIYKAIAKVGEVRKCDPPKDRDLPGWVLKRAKNPHRAEIDLAAANQLAELIGADLGRLDSELAKLAIVCDGGKITPADVTKSVSFQREQEIWEITTLLGRGKSKDAVTRWRQLVQADNSAEFRMITWLGIWLENCRLILRSQATNDPPMADVAKKIRIWDRDVMKDTVTTTAKLGRAGVARNLAALTDLDRRVKSGLASAAEGIERFIATALEE